MPGFGDLLNVLGRVANTAQGGVAGTISGFNKWIDDDLDPEGRLKYNNPISGLISGLSNPMSPTKTADYEAGNYTGEGSGFKKAFGFGLDVGLDPLSYAGAAPGALKALGIGGRTAELAGAAGSASKLGKEAGLTEKLAQTGRRFATGTRLAAGNPGGGLLWAGAGKYIEPRLAKSAAVQNLLEKAGGLPSKIPGVATKEVASATPSATKVGIKTRLLGAKGATTPGVADEAVASVTPTASSGRTSSVRERVLGPKRTTPGVAAEPVASATPTTPDDFVDQLLTSSGVAPKQLAKAEDDLWISQIDRMTGNIAPKVTKTVENGPIPPWLKTGNGPDDEFLKRFATSIGEIQPAPTLEKMMMDPRFSHLNGAAKSSAVKKALREALEAYG